MKYVIDIQSVSDLITNSSSESFTIYTTAPVDVVREWFYSALRKWGYTDEEIDEDSSIGGHVHGYNGKVIIDYNIMCNVNESIYDLLAETFGAHNVKSEYF